MATVASSIRQSLCARGSHTLFPTCLVPHNYLADHTRSAPTSFHVRGIHTQLSRPTLYETAASRAPAALIMPSLRLAPIAPPAWSHSAHTYSMLERASAPHPTSALGDVLRRSWEHLRALPRRVNSQTTLPARPPHPLSRFATSKLQAAGPMRPSRSPPRRSSPSGPPRTHRSSSSPSSSPLTAWLSRIPPRQVVIALMIANTVVFLAWNYAQISLSNSRDPRLAQFMCDNFLCGWDNIRAGRWWTIVTSTISQADFWHFAFNMFGLYGIAAPLSSGIGTPATLSLYFGCGLAGAAGSLLWTRYGSVWLKNRRNGGTSMAPDPAAMHTRSHGASGALFGFMSCTACIAPRASFVIWNILPVPAGLFVPGMLGFELYRTWTQTGGNTDTVAHITGIAAGIAFYLIKFRRGRFI